MYFDVTWMYCYYPGIFRFLLYFSLLQENVNHPFSPVTQSKIDRRRRQQSGIYEANVGLGFESELLAHRIAAAPIQFSSENPSPLSKRRGFMKGFVEVFHFMGFM